MYACNNYIKNVTHHPAEEISTISKIGEAFTVTFPSSPVLSSSMSTRRQHCPKKCFYHSCFLTLCILQTIMYVSFKHFFLVLHVLHHTHTHTHTPFYIILYFFSHQVILCQFRFVKFIISIHASTALFIFTAIFYRMDISQIGDPFSTENLLGCFQNIRISNSDSINIFCISPFTCGHEFFRFYTWVWVGWQDSSMDFKFYQIVIFSQTVVLIYIPYRESMNVPVVPQHCKHSILKDSNFYQSRC